MRRPWLRELAAELGRTYAAVRTRASRIGAHFNEAPTAKQTNTPTRAPTRERLCRRPYLAAPVRDRNSISIASTISVWTLVSSCAAMTRSCRATSGVT